MSWRLSRPHETQDQVGPRSALQICTNRKDASGISE